MRRGDPEAEDNAGTGADDADRAGSRQADSRPAKVGELVRIAAHALKGQAGNLAAGGLFDAAHVLGAEDVGRLAPGYKADVLLLDAPDWRYLAYHLGGDRFAARIKSGRVL